MRKLLILMIFVVMVMVALVQMVRAEMVENALQTVAYSGTSGILQAEEMAQVELTAMAIDKDIGVDTEESQEAEHIAHSQSASYELEGTPIIIGALSAVEIPARTRSAWVEWSACRREAIQLIAEDPGEMMKSMISIDCSSDVTILSSA